MPGARSVAGLARHAGRQSIRIEVVVRGRSGGVAPKATLSFLGAEATPQSAIEITGCLLEMSCGYIEPPERFVETQAAFVEGAIALINVGLPFVPQAEGPNQWLCDGVLAIANGIGRFLARLFDFIAEGNFVKHQAGLAAQNFGILRLRRSVGHRRLRPTRGFRGVTLCAFGWPDEFLPWAAALCWPPALGLHAVLRGHGNRGNGGSLCNTFR